MRLVSLVAVVALCGALGCGGNTALPMDTKVEPPKPDTKKSGVPTQQAAEPWGTVTGQITWGGGAVPALPPLAVTADIPHCTSKGPIPDEKWLINKDNKGVKNVIVWLIDGSDPKAPKAPPVHPSLKEIKDREVVMDQPCCKFEPRVLALRQGQVLVAKNSSPVNHNFNYTLDNKVIPAGGKLEAELTASDRPLAVSCNIHPWMKGWIRVFDHPYFAVTDADGKFEIKNAPAGHYNVLIWHEDAGWVVEGGKRGKPIEIKAGGVTTVDASARPTE
jgi:hypothetical protein